MDKKILEHYQEYFNNQEGRLNQTAVCTIITKNKNKALSVMEERSSYELFLLW